MRNILNAERAGRLEQTYFLVNSNEMKFAFFQYLGILLCAIVVTKRSSLTR